MINRYINRKHLLSLSLFYFLFLTLQISCKKDDEEIVITNPKSELFLEYRFNGYNYGDDCATNDKSFHKLRSSGVAGISSAWLENGWGDGSVWLRKEISYNLLTGNEEQLNVVIGLQGSEKNKDLLILRDENLNYWERRWDYTSTDAEIKNLWNEPRVSLVFNNHALTTFSTLEVVKAEKAWVDGVEKTYVELRFSGEAFGIYGPEHPLYTIKNGWFKGVLE